MIANQGLDQKILIRRLLWSVLAALVLYGGSVVIVDYESFRYALTKLNWQDWFLVLSLSLINYGLRFVRWEIYLEHLESRISTMRSLAYYVGGFAFTTTPGKAGEAIRSLYLKRHGIDYVKSLAAFFSERFIDLIAMVMLALFATFTFPEYQWPVAVVSVCILILIPILHAKSFHTLLKRLIDIVPSQRIQDSGSHLLELLVRVSSLMKSRILVLGLLLAIIAWGAEGVAFQLILQALDIQISIALAVGIYSVSVLVGALSFVPGGIGGTEAVMILLLKVLGIDTPTAFAATLICRVATLWFAVAIGGIVLTLVETTATIEKR